MDQQVIKYSVTDAAISTMKSEYMALTIAGVDDKDGFDQVHKARMVVKGKRIEVENTRKELKADALAWGKAVDKEAKRLFGLLEPIETHLQNEENRVVEEKAKIKAEEERREQERIQGRIDELAKFDCSLPFFEVAGLSDEEYLDLLETAKSDFEIAQQKRAAEEAERKAKEEAEQKAREEEQRRLAEERAKLEVIRKEQEAREAALNAEAERMKAEQQRMVEQKRLEEAKKEAAERALKEEAERREREEAEKKRQEALLPDKQKAETYFLNIMNIECPEFTLDAVTKTINEFNEDLYVLMQETLLKIK